LINMGLVHYPQLRVFDRVFIIRNFVASLWLVNCTKTKGDWCIQQAVNQSCWNSSKFHRIWTFGLMWANELMSEYFGNISIALIVGLMFFLWHREYWNFQDNKN
jgi:hypothetical protein